MTNSISNAQEMSLPGFGEVPPSAKEIEPDHRILGIALHTIGIIAAASLVIGSAILVATLTPLTPIAIAVSATLVFTAIISTVAIAKKIFRHTRSATYDAILDKSTLDHNNKNAPKVGQKLNVDLFASNNTAKTFEMRKNLIKSAKKSIEWSFNFAGEEPFQEVLELIDTQMKNESELKVHFLMSRDMLTNENKVKLKQLKNTFNPRFNYLITDRYFLTDDFTRSEENHVKLLVVDGKYFSLGGSGVSNGMVHDSDTGNSNKGSSPLSNIIKTYNDSDVFGRVNLDQVDNKKNMSRLLRSQFFNLYQILAKRMDRKLKEDEGLIFDVSNPCDNSLIDNNHKMVTDCKVTLLTSTFNKRGKNPIDEKIAQLITSAKKTVKIANWIFNPSQQIKTALKESSAKKIGFFNSKQHFIHGFFTVPSREHYPLLDEIHENVFKGDIQHKKVITIDEKISIIGSYNLTTKSSICDNEIVLVVENEEITKQINEGIERDKNKSKQVSNKNRSTVIGWLASKTVNLFM